MMKNSILLTCLVMLAGFVTVYGQKTTFRGTKTQVETSFERQMLDMALKHLEEEGCGHPYLREKVREILSKMDGVKITNSMSGSDVIATMK